MISVEKIVFTLNSSGAGTVVSTSVISGEIVEVRVPNAGTTWMGVGATADVTLTRLEDGGTILNFANGSAPWEKAPRQLTHDTSGGDLTAYDTVPVSDHIQLVVSTGQADKAGTVYVHYAI